MAPPAAARLLRLASWDYKKGPGYQILNLMACLIRVDAKRNCFPDRRNVYFRKASIVRNVRQQCY
jgi:hypothetical protein